MDNIYRVEPSMTTNVEVKNTNQHVNVANSENASESDLKVISTDFNKISSIRINEGVDFNIIDEGIWLDESYANALNYSVGNLISFRLQGEVEDTDVIISEVIKSPFPQGIFLSRGAYEKLGKKYNSTALLSEQKELSEDIIKQSFVEEYMTSSEQYDSWSMFLFKS